MKYEKRNEKGKNMIIAQSTEDNLRQAVADIKEAILQGQ